MAERSEMVFGAASDTQRVALDPASEEHRLGQARRARGNLAAILVNQAGGLGVVEADGSLVAAEFQELCDMLGLDPPAAREPGMCRRDGCDNALAVASSMRATGGSLSDGTSRGEARRKGYCSNRCMRTSYLPKPGGAA